MRRFLTSMTVVVLALGASGTARADVVVRARPFGFERRVVVTGRPASNYYALYGTRFAGGWYYRGLNHAHWTYTYWSNRYHCPLYWDPSLRCYYYWHQPTGSYYPVSYIRTAPPVVAPGAAPIAGMPVVDGIPPSPPPTATMP